MLDCARSVGCIPYSECFFVAVVQGTFLTKPFMWPVGMSLHLNADARFGEIYVEVADLETGACFIMLSG